MKHSAVIVANGVLRPNDAWSPLVTGSCRQTVAIVLSITRSLVPQNTYRRSGVEAHSLAVRPHLQGETRVGLAQSAGHAYLGRLAVVIGGAADEVGSTDRAVGSTYGGLLRVD